MIFGIEGVNSVDHLGVSEEAHFTLVLDNVDGVAHSELLAVCLVDNDAAGRAALGGRHGGVSARAALASVDEEGASAAHLAGLLGLQVEGAGPRDGRGVHGVFAVAELVPRCGEGAHVLDALLGRLHEAGATATVAVGVDSPDSGSSDEVAGVLIVGVGLGGSAGFKRFTTFCVAGSYLR